MNKEVGLDIRECRQKKNLTLKVAAEYMGISENYLSEIERGLKNPNDDIIRKAANLYNLDEKHLYDRFGKIPLVVQEELKDNDIMSRTLYGIATNEDLTEEDKKELSKAIESLVMEWEDSRK